MVKLGYLTIDDGPTETFREKLDYLNELGVKAIWFCLGKDLKNYSDDVVHAIHTGHIIGNHSFSHPNFSSISIDEAKQEISRTDHIIDELYSKAQASRTHRLFRFPFLNNGSDDAYRECDWNNTKVNAIQNHLRTLSYRQPKFEGITYKWYQDSGFKDCANIDCTYDSFDWCLQPGTEMFGYKDLTTVLRRIDEDVPEGGRGLNSNSNEIIMMHSWIPQPDFKAIIDKLSSKVTFVLPE